MNRPDRTLTTPDHPLTERWLAEYRRLLCIGDAFGALLVLKYVQRAGVSGWMKGWWIEACREVYRRLRISGDYAGALRAVKLLSTVDPGESALGPSGPSDYQGSRQLDRSLLL